MYTNKRREYRRQYYQDNKEKIAKQTKEYHDNHPDLYRKSARKSMGRLYDRRRSAILELLGGTCNKCGFSDERALQIDHVNGGGRDDKARFSSTSIYYKHILEVEGKGYQLLCANCNWIKRHENKELPYRKERNVKNTKTSRRQHKTR